MMNIEWSRVEDRKRAVPACTIYEVAREGKILENTAMKVLGSVQTRSSLRLIYELLMLMSLHPILSRDLQNAYNLLLLLWSIILIQRSFADLLRKRQLQLAQVNRPPPPTVNVCMSRPMVTLI